MKPQSVDEQQPGKFCLWMTSFARGCRRKTADMGGNELSRPLFVLILVLILVAITGYLLMGYSGRAALPIFALQILFLLIGGATIRCVFRRINRQLLEPLAHLREWALRMRTGNLSARLPLPGSGEFASLAHDINALADQLETLTQDMNAQVRAQTMRISRKTRSLEILYEVVASLSTARNRDELLEYFLETLVELMDAHAASVSLLSASNSLQPVASHSNMEKILVAKRLENINRELCSAAIAERKIKIYRMADKREGLAPQSDLIAVSPELIAVPIQYRGGILGLYTLFLDRSRAELGDDFRDLLTSVGRHVGLALEKARLDENTRRLAIMEERDILRNELHDSLAQSLVSMRFRVKMLGEVLHKKDLRAAQNEVRQLHMSLEEAHDSLRELLASFRSKMDDRGLVPAIEDAVERFSQDTGISTFFQYDCKHLHLSATQEVEVFRIVQEGLANIRRHSQAHTARIFLSEDSLGNYRLLLEDDGTGITEPSFDARRGHHFGLTIMRERAKRLHGDLVVESEPGEGTRVTLRFTSNKPSQASLVLPQGNIDDGCSVPRRG